MATAPKARAKDRGILPGVPETFTDDQARWIMNLVGQLEGLLKHRGVTGDQLTSPIQFDDGLSIEHSRTGLGRIKLCFEDRSTRTHGHGVDLCVNGQNVLTNDALRYQAYFEFTFFASQVEISKNNATFTDIDASFIDWDGLDFQNINAATFEFVGNSQSGSATIEVRIMDGVTVVETFSQVLTATNDRYSFTVADSTIQKATEYHLEFRRSAGAQKVNLLSARLLVRVD